MDERQAHFHVVRRPTWLGAIARDLYGDASSDPAQAFSRINARAVRHHLVWPGQLLFIPASVCYHPQQEAEFGELVGRINDLVMTRINQAEREVLASHPNLVNQAAANPGLVHEAARYGSMAGAGLVSMLSAEHRAVRDLLKELEGRYLQTYRAHGRLTPDFFAQRRRIFAALDTLLGRMARALSLGTPMDQRARDALKISSKSQILHWKRHGTAGGLKDLKAHFERMAQVSRYLRAGGHLAIALDAYLTYDTITRACRAEDERECQRSAVVQGSAFAGSVLGGTFGGGLAYAACSAVFALPSAGSSLLWCALAAGGAGSVVGGSASSQMFRVGADWLFETYHPVVAH